MDQKTKTKPTGNNKRSKAKTPKGNQALIANFNNELNTASAINARCITHNVELNDKFNYIGHLATLLTEKHIIHAELRDGKTIELVPVMSYKIKTVKTIKKEKANP